MGGLVNRSLQSSCRMHFPTSHGDGLMLSACSCLNSCIRKAGSRQINVDMRQQLMRRLLTN